MSTSVIGRADELAAIERLLDLMLDGPAALVFEGDPGIGKTTLWRSGLEMARRIPVRTLVSRGAGAEVKLTYAALTDLLAEVEDDEIALLPVPQRRALATAVLRAEPAEGEPPDPRAVATGLLTLLENLAEADPILLAVDELQWLDRSSAMALRFAARRLRGPVGLLAARRNPPTPPASDELRLREPERLQLLRLAPLATGEIQRLLRDRIGETLTAPALRRIEHIAAGNPFVALELGRALGPNAQTAVPPLPESLRELVAARLSGLEAGVLDALLVAAALTQPRLATIEAALDGGDAAELLGRAESAEIVAIEGGMVSFAHPVLASGVYARATGPERRAAHRRLAEVVQGTEERARHLALAGVEPEARGNHAAIFFGVRDFA